MTKTSHSANALQVRQALWDLQKEVLTCLKDQFDHEVGYQSAPTEWLQILMASQRYAWLRELTSLMADIDIMTELEFITDQHVGIAHSEIERLFFKLDSEDEASFAKNFRALLTHDGSLLPLHSQLRAALQALPKAEASKDLALAERKNWQEEHRFQARKKRN